MVITKINMKIRNNAIVMIMLNMTIVDDYNNKEKAYSKTKEE